MRRQHTALSRKEPRQERSRATVDAIIFAAAHILRSEGRAAVTTNKIARVAGVSIGSLYQYFPNKEAVLAEVQARRSEWFETETRAGIERGAELPLREGVRASIARMIEIQTIDEDATPRRPLAPEEFVSFRDQTAAYLRANAEQLRPADPELAAVIVTRATEALIHGLVHDEPEWAAHPGFVDEVTELVVGYLTPRARSE